MVAILFGYTGPGAGLTMLGSLLAVLVLLLLALLAPVVFTIRMLMKLFTRPTTLDESVEVEAAESHVVTDEVALVHTDGN